MTVIVKFTVRNYLIKNCLFAIKIHFLQTQKYGLAWQ